MIPGLLIWRSVSTSSTAAAEMRSRAWGSRDKAFKHSVTAAPSSRNLISAILSFSSAAGLMTGSSTISMTGVPIGDARRDHKGQWGCDACMNLTGETSSRLCATRR